MLKRLILIGLVAGAVSGGFGCGTAPPNPSDPAAGRTALQQSLEAWKRGDTPDSYKRSSGVIAVDKEWNDGVKLLDFDIAPDSVADGYDVQFKAKLTIKDASGKTSTQKAVYNVSTTPNLVIVRAAS